MDGPEACWCVACLLVTKLTDAGFREALQTDLAEVIGTRTRGSVLVLAQCGLPKSDMFSMVRVSFDNRVCLIIPERPRARSTA